MPLTAAEVLSAGLKPPGPEKTKTAPTPTPLPPVTPSSADVLLEALAAPTAGDQVMPDAFERVVSGESQMDSGETEAEAAGALLVLTGTNGKLSHNQVCRAICLRLRFVMFGADFASRWSTTDVCEQSSSSTTCVSFCPVSSCVPAAPCPVPTSILCIYLLRDVRY